MSQNVKHTSGSSLSILDVRVDNINRKQALDRIQQFIVSRNGRGARKVYFTNVHSIHVARRNDELRSGINAADLVLPDGSGLKIAGRILSKTNIENLNGTDFTPELLRLAEDRRWTVYLYGAETSVLENCRGNLQRQYPRLQIVGLQHGYISMTEQELFLEDINQKKPDIVLVALGTPAQEFWIARNAPELNAGVCLAVGGLFDFIAGKHSRAPQWMRALGIEWLYRLIQDPKGKADRVFVEIPAFMIVLVGRWLSSRRLADRK